MWHRRSGAEKAKDIAHLATYYWSRLIATAGCWFFWDFGFYGNKVFQSQFVSILTGGSASLEPVLIKRTLSPSFATICCFEPVMDLLDMTSCEAHRSLAPSSL